MFKKSSVALLTCLMMIGSLVSTGSAQDAALGVAETPELGEFLTDAEGMTLYTFTKDEPGVSNCYDECATNWPPVYVEGATLPDGVEGELTEIERTDGTMQLAFNGWPLYTFVGDQAPGDTTGQGLNEVWWVASTAPAMEASPMASPVAADTVVLIAETPELGMFLTDADGMTLYIFTNDEPGVSNCDEGCLANWPPFVADEADLANVPEGFEGELTLIDLADGTQMVAYNDQPLYYFIGDQAAGDTTGQGVGDVWFVATVEPAS